MTTEKTKIAPHEDLLAEHSIEISALPEKTQKRIAKFKEETDEEKQDPLDESICGDIWDYIEEKEEQKKKEEKKKKHEELKEKAKLDLSAAETAQKEGKGNSKGEKNDAVFFGKHFGK